MRRFAGIEEIESQITQIGWMNTDDCSAALLMVEARRQGTVLEFENSLSPDVIEKSQQ